MFNILFLIRKECLKNSISCSAQWPISCIWQYPWVNYTCMLFNLEKRPKNIPSSDHRYSLARFISHFKVRWWFFSILKPTRYTISEIYFISGTTLHVSDSLSVHHQESSDCTHSNRYMLYRSCGCLLAGTRCSISFPLASSHRTCMTYTWCCMCGLRLMMMDGETVRNM